MARQCLSGEGVITCGGLAVSRVLVLLIVGGLTTCSVGCQSARYVSRQSDSGVIAIPSNSNSWPFHYRQEAETLIRQHVGPDYEIVDEREVVTGTRVTNDEHTQRDLTPNKKQPNMPGERIATTGTATSSNVSEWQITYKKRQPFMNIGNARTPVTNSPTGVQPAGGTAPPGPG